jgi:hypothetical protein
MRRRLRKFLPIVLIAVMVQILAPIAACWAASIAASDPLHPAVICHDNAASTQGGTDQTGQPGAHDGCCSVCSVAQTGAPVDTPQATVTTPDRQPLRVEWLDSAPDLFGSRTGSHAQARAPPSIS